MLLTAYADIDAAIRVINEIRLDHYLMKPWDPPDERLYPVLTDLLDDWQASFLPPFQGVSVIGYRYAARSHEIKDFLARNLIPYRWLDIASEGLRTILVESEAPGGQAGMSSSIENYLGFPVGVSGSDLARRAVSQAKRFGAEFLTPLEATGLRLRDGYRLVDLSNGTELSSHTLLIATGVSYRQLEVPGADRLAGTGLYYGAAITEALASKDKDVFIVGGGNSAGQAAMYLAKYARSVSLLVRSSSLAASMSQYLIAQLDTHEKIEVQLRTKVVALHGERTLEAVTLANLDSGEERTLRAHALFAFIGALPRTDWVAGVVERDPQGFILTGHDLNGGQRPRGWRVNRDPYWLETSVPGIFAAGDVRHRSIKRAASAVGEGAMVVQFVHQYLQGL